MAAALRGWNAVFQIVKAIALVATQHNLLSILIALNDAGALTVSADFYRPYAIVYNLIIFKDFNSSIVAKIFFALLILIFLNMHRGIFKIADTFYVVVVGVGNYNVGNILGLYTHLT